MHVDQPTSAYGPVELVFQRTEKPQGTEIESQMDICWFARFNTIRGTKPFKTVTTDDERCGIDDEQ